VPGRFRSNAGLSKKGERDLKGSWQSGVWTRGKSTARRGGKEKMKGHLSLFSEGKPKKKKGKKARLGFRLEPVWTKWERIRGKRISTTATRTPEGEKEKREGLNLEFRKFSSEKEKRKE